MPSESAEQLRLLTEQFMDEIIRNHYGQTNPIRQRLRNFCLV